MLEGIRALQDRISALERTTRASRSQQIWSRSIKDEARSIVDDYFRKTRPSIGNTLRDSQVVSQTDESMQVLLDASHKSLSSAKFRSILSQVRGFLVQLETDLLYAVSAPPIGENLELLDIAILQTLERLVPTAAISYKQAILDLKSSARLSWRGPAADLREALREVLDHLAPDEDVKAQPSFRLEPDAKGPTMKQKVRYILSRRGYHKSATEAPADAASAVDEIMGSFVRSVYTRSSLSAHTPSNKTEVLRLRNFVRIALAELLELADQGA